MRLAEDDGEASVMNLTRQELVDLLEALDIAQGVYTQRRARLPLASAARGDLLERANRSHALSMKVANAYKQAPGRPKEHV